MIKYGGNAIGMTGKDANLILAKKNCICKSLMTMVAPKRWIWVLWGKLRVGE
ncbi:hypothetical protein E9W_08822 [Moraxella catarrhalis CO72]|nr:hypothetical protein E9W_08822 [Moraxella catarrhalis CO72]